MKMFTSRSKICITIVLVCSLSLVALGKLDDDEDEWIDPYDMLNYDASTKTMRKPAEQPTNYPNVPTKRREYVQDSDQMDLTECSNKVEGLQREIEEHKRRITVVSQQPSCNPVFKRFLTKLLNEIERVGLPSDLSSDIHYDAKVKLSRQAVGEIRKLLEGMDSWRTGALDDAVSQVLVGLKPHDYEAWRWHFEDTFGVEIDTVMKVSVCVLIIAVIICSEMWSVVSWFVQFKRLFAICFFISIVWNWFYLYKIAFAEHQSNIIKMESVNEKCTGMKKIDWSDNLKEWFRSTLTLQDDPCKKYYEVLMVNPILLVPPTKAMSITITTFITEPLKHFGQGISEFLRALLKDLPVTLQIPVLLTIVLSILVFMYGSSQAAIYGFTSTLRGGRRDPPPPAVVQPQPQPAQLRGADHDPLAGGDAPQHAPLPLRRRANQGGQDGNPLRQRRPPRARKEPTRVFVETLRNADWPFSEDEIDSAGREGEQPEDVEDTDPATEEETDVQEEETLEESIEAGARISASDLQAKPSPAKPVKAKAKTPNAIAIADVSSVSSEPRGTDSQVEQQTEEQSSPAAQGNDVQEASVAEKTSSISGEYVETVPVQETDPMSLAP